MVGVDWYPASPNGKAKETERRAKRRLRRWSEEKKKSSTALPSKTATVKIGIAPFQQSIFVAELLFFSRAHSLMMSKKAQSP